MRSTANAATLIAALHQGQKRSVFADSRARAEELAAALRGHGVTVFVSHSSLSADERRLVERAFAEARDCVIVATSTLELGIDVGDVDRVIRLGAPRTVASVLQRIGRTGRRAGTTRNCLFLATRDDELLQALALVRLVSAAGSSRSPPQRSRSPRRAAFACPCFSPRAGSDAVSGPDRSGRWLSKPASTRQRLTVFWSAWSATTSWSGSTVFFTSVSRASVGLGVGPS